MSTECTIGCVGLRLSIECTIECAECATECVGLWMSIECTIECD